MPNAFRYGSDPRTGWTILSLPVTWDYDTDYAVHFDRSIRAQSGTPLQDAPYILKFHTIALSEQGLLGKTQSRAKERTPSQ